MRIGRLVVSFVLFIVWLLAGAGVDAQAQPLSAKDLAANQDLNRRWVEAFNRKDVNAVMSLFWNSPNLVRVFPDGAVYKGWDKARQGLEQFFSGLETVRGEITEVTHLRSGDGVVSVGTFATHLQPKAGPPQQLTVRWTDFRRKIGNQWVLVHDHVAALPPRAQPAAPLYGRLGGYDAIAAVVDDFLPRLLHDAELKRFFGGVSADSAKRIRQLLVDQLCAATGGPCVYIGRDMKVSHAGLGISSRDWELAVGHLVATLDKFQVPAREKNEVLAANGSLKPHIVEK